jgi:hypothetical protein
MLAVDNLACCRLTRWSSCYHCCSCYCCCYRCCQALELNPNLSEALIAQAQVYQEECSTEASAGKDALSAYSKAHAAFTDADKVGANLYTTLYYLSSLRMMLRAQSLWWYTLYARRRT